VVYGGIAHPPAIERAGADKPPPKDARASVLPDSPSYQTRPLPLMGRQVFTRPELPPTLVAQPTGFAGATRQLAHVHMRPDCLRRQVDGKHNGLASAIRRLSIGAMLSFSQKATRTCAIVKSLRRLQVGALELGVESPLLMSPHETQGVSYASETGRPVRRDFTQGWEC